MQGCVFGHTHHLHHLLRCAYSALNLLAIVVRPFRSVTQTPFYVIVRPRIDDFFEEKKLCK